MTDERIMGLGAAGASLQVFFDARPFAPMFERQAGH
jgi:hypothetical protein